MATDGFDIPIHRSLTQQIMLAGVPRDIAILNGTFVATFGLGLHSFWSIPVGLIIYTLAVVATKKDPQFFGCFRRHIKQKNYYGT
ncbi:MAG: VirB3 family type IV secretion system protein [Desulfuromonadales bacterium]|nr:VirB3 family type IV secretion system protein [Desulfuromonadales bacterium]